ncbi:hypothetical protein NC652_039484 [Populus alba x Populus x berolinensis]|nr:hypothetical protein NC652_039484 [Populus alba x Populus x berolinensis]
MKMKMKMKKTEEKIACGKSIVVTLALSLHSVSRQIKNKEYHRVRIKPRKTLPYLSSRAVEILRLAVVTFRGSDGIEASSVAIQGWSSFTVCGKAWWFLLQAVARTE